MVRGSAGPGRWWRAACLAFAVLMVASGCGGDEDEVEDTAFDPTVSVGDWRIRPTPSVICTEWKVEDGGVECVEFAAQRDFDPSNLDNIDTLADLLEQGIEAAEETDTERFRRTRQQIADLMEQRGIRVPPDQPNNQDLPFAGRYRPRDVPVEDWTAMRRALIALRALF